MQIQLGCQQSLSNNKLSCLSVKPIESNKNSLLLAHQQKQNHHQKMIGLSFSTNSVSFSQEIENQNNDSFLKTEQTPLITKCIKLLTKKGKQSKAQTIIRKTFKRLNTMVQSDVFATSALSSAELIRKQKLIINESIENKNEIQIVKKNIGYNTYYFFEQAVNNIKPLFEFKKLRLSGITQQIPAVLSPNRQEKKALRWLIEAAKAKKKKKTGIVISKSNQQDKNELTQQRDNNSRSLDYFLALEIKEAAQGQGELRNKRDEIHKLAELNRGLTHYRWWK